MGADRWVDWWLGGKVGRLVCEWVIECLYALGGSEWLGVWIDVRIGEYIDGWVSG